MALAHDSIPQEPWVPSDTLGLRLLALRHELGLSQEEAATACGLKPSTWATWENGTSSPRNLAAVARAIRDGLGADERWIVFGGPLRSTCFMGDRLAGPVLSIVPDLADEPGIRTESHPHDGLVTQPPRLTMVTNEHY